jgi:poly(3-hydroxyalkanoate) synthetase
LPSSTEGRDLQEKILMKSCPPPEQAQANPLDQAVHAQLARLPPAHEGSWWPALQDWLQQHASGRTAPPAMGAEARGCPVLEDAPGRYVLIP